MNFDRHVKNLLERYDEWDEADDMYKVEDGRLMRRSFKHALLDKARKMGYSDTHEAALKRAGIMKSKFDPKKYVQNMGGKWVQVFPYGKPEETSQPPQPENNTPPAV
jgi:hypothetical protein